MTGRASVFSDDKVIAKLNKHFVNVAIDINFVKHQQDNEGEFFRKIAEQGHYAGRTKPTNTRQGLYVATADGNLLASVNTTRPRDALAMVEKAIKRFGNSDAYEIKKFAASNSPDKRFNIAFPKGGLILRQTTRDLPRSDDPDFATWRHNFDHVWLAAKELKSFVPVNPKVGETYSIPAALAKRLAMFHFVDQVKGEADAFRKSAVDAEMQAKVSHIEDQKISIRIRGKAKCTQPPTGDRNPYSGNRIKKERGVDVLIRGRLKYDASEKSFGQFDLVVFGDRWGAATYNFRSQDMGPAPIGFAFEMLSTTPENMTRPKFLLWDYFQSSTTK